VVFNKETDRWIRIDAFNTYEKKYQANSTYIKQNSPTKAGLYNVFEPKILIIVARTPVIIKSAFSATAFGARASFCSSHSAK
jgi:hypothetical protein